jgi:hypothetical protein
MFKYINNKSTPGAEGIIFSMNRPLQLYSLLESYYINCDTSAKLNILIKITNSCYLNEYLKIKNDFKNQNINFVFETNFKSDLQNIISQIKTSHLFFLVDDIIFIRKFTFIDFFNLKNYNNYIFSLRLGLNLNYCYPKSIYQTLPIFKKHNKFNSWNWYKNKINGDWGYVFSVDGNVYEKNQIKIMSKIINYKAPNSYESNMNIFRFILMQKKGLCYDKSILVNVSLGRVNQEIDNISGYMPIESLLDSWQNGYKIDIKFFQNFDNKSAHIEVKNLLLKKVKHINVES